MSKGIDYGLGQTNVDRKTGIRFGVIHQNEVLQAWADSSEADYGEAEGGDLPDEPLGYVLDDGEYTATSDTYGDIFVTKSPYYTRAAFCSPCAPGACYLTQPTRDGEQAYCFGHDWFENGVAPYPVYAVADDEKIAPGS